MYDAGATSYVALVDAMIARAEVACERYRRSAQQDGLNLYVARSRRQALQQMELSLSRLRAQRMRDQTPGVSGNP